ncbi:MULTISPECIES: sodium-extruding oxaloacetate decarboxylase subunit alpha [unclassified Marinobacterium]|uniref:sodium-extruding oxaloacetate decarboxylase subunit alpha n=1 Tax=unclassified Marinobacterium TaxID=2644139 RepID=UPI0015680FD9|nr:MULTISPECIES: sodium-extruding oxaloacetate decarboxylase subunit alpha [unclassified Marinobacterium]NRP28329.1 Methylmalonyl-CoA carboxyltransferase 5S subunit [Marinobacterium sp. xm-d-420]NRP38156.1 Methylmalonyl-CoA carboxyltransferase 5S subunit [Marinobacterium sp. xm-a-121]NRP57572.1 Methylmalonyl-CoA carboxyltransferase 5S subunit [Marinobacterium sp. xm-d-510]NRP98084.1 Methylmalonyl-CoA carboxyltransferase 5S subunit [Marinobacterium sp. xm-a-127]NRP98828.1 Methylmalonyl-CoA carb
MSDANKPLGITDVVLRDAHQSLFATRLRLDDMLPIAEKLDKIGYWSLESWGGATFDSCIRYLGEDPWDRIRQLKAAMPNTRQQMLLRGQNLLGYRHYGDDVVERFVERSAESGIDVFRIFDAMNDPRNLEKAIAAVKATGKHAQGTISYTTSPVHTIDMWVDYAKTLEDMGADSINIKDMSGILTPYGAFDLVSRLKAQTGLEVQLHAHATAGLSDMTILKAVEAGIDRVDTAISSMSMTYGHTATESVVAALAGTDRDTGLNLEALEEIAAYFREVRKKYAKFEGSLRGTDSRILVAQVPGGMLTNMESQLKEQGAADKFDEVLAEIPRVREDLGYIPLVTPTSQIVGTQAVINVLVGERYKTISKEVQGILKGEYGAAPAPYNAELQAKVLDGAEAITCRPADLIEPEMDKLVAELKEIAVEKGIELETGEREIDDVLTYALFPQIGLKFLENRGNPDAFEPVPTLEDALAMSAPKKSGPEVYTITVNGQNYVVQVAEGGDITAVAPAAAEPAAPAAAPAGSGEPVPAPLAGNIWKVQVSAGQAVQEGDVLVILEAMKMETEVRAARAGTVTSVDVKEGDAVQVGDSLVSLA